MFNGHAFRGAILLTVLTLAGCRDAARGNVGADTARPSAVATPAPVGVAAASKDTTTLSHPHAGAPPALVLGATTISLYSTSFVDVGSAFGPPSIGDDSTGDFRELKACYVAGAADERVTVQLSAGDFMGERATTQQAMAKLPINQASVARGDLKPWGSHPPKRCVPLPVPLAEIHWSNGLRLGMTRVEAERLLGPPKKKDGAEWVYDYDEPHFRQVSVDRATGQEVVTNVSVTVGVRVRYDHDVATRIEAWYFTEPN